MQATAIHGDIAPVKLRFGQKTEKTMRYDFDMWNVTTLPRDLVAKVSSALK
jgi:hypothetical protein